MYVNIIDTYKYMYINWRPNLILGPNLILWLGWAPGQVAPRPGWRPDSGSALHNNIANRLILTASQCALIVI